MFLATAASGKVGVGAECAPQWLWFTFAVGLFVYQSLDAIDGKQARRTGTSGPLGELFDHGCDALNTTLEVILSAAAMNLGLSWWTSECSFWLRFWWRRCLSEREADLMCLVAQLRRWSLPMRTSTLLPGRSFTLVRQLRAELNLYSTSR